MCFGVAGIKAEKGNLSGGIHVTFSIQFKILQFLSIQMCIEQSMLGRVIGSCYSADLKVPSVFSE